MRGWLKLVLLGAAAVVGAEIWFRAQHHDAEAEGAAPSFTLPDLEGKPVSLEAFRGQVVAINFWATWCLPCREEIPELSRIYDARKGQCFQMLGIAEESGTPAEVAASARSFGISYPVLVDAEGRTGEAYRIPGYPRTYLVDHQGRIRRTFDGAVGQGELEAALEPLLASAPAGCPRAM